MNNQQKKSSGFVSGIGKQVMGGEGRGFIVLHIHTYIPINEIIISIYLELKSANFLNRNDHSPYFVCEREENSNHVEIKYL